MKRWGSYNTLRFPTRFYLQVTLLVIIYTGVHLTRDETLTPDQKSNVIRTSKFHLQSPLYEYIQLIHLVQMLLKVSYIFLKIIRFDE